MGNFQDAIKFIHLNRLDGFNIRTGTSAEAMVFKYDDSESREDNIARAQSVMDVTPGTFFTLTGWVGKNQSRGTFQFQFTNTQQQQQMVQQQQMGSVYDEKYIDDKVAAAVDKVRAEYEKRDLEKREKELREERKEFEQERNSVLGLLVDKVAPMIKGLRPTQVAGLDAGEQPTEQIAAPQYEEEQEGQEYEFPDAVCVALQEWAAVEPAYEQLLVALVERAKNNDTMYLLAKQELLKQQ